jgi:hypothetical protein
LAFFVLWNHILFIAKTKMVIAHLERLTNKNFRHVRELANQIAGRKRRRKTAFDFRVPRNMQHRARQSAYKDIAGAHSKHQVVDWIKEDAHHPNTVGGSLSDAFRHTIHVMHHVHRRDLLEHGTGGSITGLIGDAAHYLKRGHEVLENVAGTKLMQAEILADDALDKIGIRKSRYPPLQRTQQNRLHARLAQEVYKAHGDRGSVDGWDYDDGNDRYGVFKRGNQRIVHWRGTKPDKNVISSGDLAADGKIAFGESDSMQGLAMDKKIVTDLLDAGYDTSIGGYSLGGGRALSIANDDAIYKRLGNLNHVISPGITSMNPHLKKLAHLDKMHFTYSAFDEVANSLMPHSTDNHHIEKKFRDPLSAHTTFLKQLAA